MLKLSLRPDLEGGIKVFSKSLTENITLLHKISSIFLHPEHASYYVGSEVLIAVTMKIMII
jgi:hypothetical protein